MKNIKIRMLITAIAFIGCQQKQSQNKVNESDSVYYIGTQPIFDSSAMGWLYMGKDSLYLYKGQTYPDSTVLNRYFLVSYNFKDSKGSGFGNINFISLGFPSEKKIENEIGESMSGSRNIVVLSIYEFKTKQDYDIFNKK